MHVHGCCVTRDNETPIGPFPRTSESRSRGSYLELDPVVDGDDLLPVLHRDVATEEQQREAGHERRVPDVDALLLHLRREQCHVIQS